MLGLVDVGSELREGGDRLRDGDHFPSIYVHVKSCESAWEKKFGKGLMSQTGSIAAR